LEIFLDLSQSRFDQLVNLIYDTLDNKDAWRDVLDALQAATGGRAVHLLAFDGEHGCLSYSAGANMAPQIDMEYIRKFQYIDPRVKLLREQPIDGWMHCHEHFDDAFVAHNPFYQEFLLPHGARYLSACKLIENEAATVLLAFLRGPEDGPMPAEAVRFLERLHPHMSRACRIGLTHFVYSTQALVGHALVDKLRQPVILLSSEGKVVLVNEAATHLLASTRLVRIDDGRLVLPERYREEFATQRERLEDMARFGAEAPGEQGFCSLHIASDDGAPPDLLYAFFNTLVPEQVMGSFGMRPLVMLYLYHPNSAQEIDADLLSAAFGLTHAECRIASLLADGTPLKTIADSLGVQYDTVRKQLLSIYQKTATNRQPELVRLLLHLPTTAVRRTLAAAPVQTAVMEGCA
jgi:DNA-binding CsgD family transcriptional regulator/PAS domain-containing protein